MSHDIYLLHKRDDKKKKTLKINGEGERGGGSQTKPEPPACFSCYCFKQGTCEKRAIIVKIESHRIRGKGLKRCLQNSNTNRNQLISVLQAGGFVPKRRIDLPDFKMRGCAREPAGRLLESTPQAGGPHVRRKSQGAVEGVREESSCRASLGPICTSSCPVGQGASCRPRPGRLPRTEGQLPWAENQGKKSC